MPQNSLLEILVATTNRGKLGEIRRALCDLPLRLRSLSEFPDVTTVAEVGTTFGENATLKALGYARQCGLYALADDSGLEVDALGGAPGVLSARYEGDGASDEDRVQKLLLALANTADRNRTARFVSSMAFAGWKQDEARSGAPRLLQMSEGICEGIVATNPEGTNGFGYDPIFVANGYDETFAQLSTEIKNRISHRARALEGMREFLHRWLRQT